MKNKTLIIIAIVVVAFTFLGNQASLYFNLQDTAGVEEGMTYAEYTALVSAENRKDFWNYSFFSNGQLPVLIRFEEDKIVQIEVIDSSQISKKQERFEKITPGMTLSQVTQMVGTPDGYSKTEDTTLAYNIRNEKLCLIQFTWKDDILYVVGVTVED